MVRGKENLPEMKLEELCLFSQAKGRQVWDMIAVYKLSGGGKTWTCEDTPKLKDTACTRTNEY